MDLGLIQRIRLRHIAAEPVTFTLALVLAIAVAAVGVRWNTNEAGGSDSYGYVSQADLWLSGHLTVAQPWVRRVPWDNAAWTFAPLGYRPQAPREHTDGDGVSTALVPKYSPGLPLLMAAAKILGGQRTLFAVVPVFGGLLVLATYGIGCRLRAPWAGLMAAWLTATSPVVLYMVVQPVSGVPAAGAWAVALWWLLGGSTRGALAAGLWAGLAVLVRTNLVAMAAMIELWLVVRAWRSSARDRHQAIQRVLAFAGGVAPSVLVVAGLNTVLNGAPWQSGYGAVDGLFALGNVGVNLRQFAGWLADTQTPVVFLGFAALVMPLVWSRRIANGRAVMVLFAMIAAVVWGEYLLFRPFDAWWYLRFLLPTWPVMMTGVALILTWPLRSGRLTAAAAVAGCALVIGISTFRVAIDRSAFDLWRGERKYAAVAHLVAAQTDPSAVIFSLQHSGSLRYYGGRVTLNFVNLDPDWFDRAVGWLEAHGAHPYALLEAWEVDDFHSRFASATASGRLHSSVFDYGRGASPITLYDLAPDAPVRRSPLRLPKGYGATEYPEPAPTPALSLK